MTSLKLCQPYYSGFILTMMGILIFRAESLTRTSKERSITIASAVPPDEVSSCQESEICMIDQVMRNRPRDHQLLCLLWQSCPADPVACLPTRRTRGF